MPLLRIENLTVRFGALHAVNGIDLDLHAGETVGIVGESGSGKSATALAAMRLVGGRTAGSVTFNGIDLMKQSPRQMQEIRGGAMAMIFQDPLTSLNPVLSIGFQIAETVRRHSDASRHQARERAIEMLQRVGIPDAARRVDDYPHQISGGMRQRVMIAMALSCNPTLLIADEPTTALDVTIQAQVLDLMSRLQSDFNTAIMLITHDLGVVAETAQRVAVMYAGQIVEEASTMELFKSPRHPYTLGLLASIPTLYGSAPPDRHFPTIPGTVPRLTHAQTGCAFHDRCASALARCTSEAPPVSERDGHKVRCWLHATN